ncbi:MAG: hypothetical protein HKN59_07445 [Gammaproteobacteria bacterium]|nr:hypothetical protein [Gammaproteobacteria bacterium]
MAKGSFFRQLRIGILLLLLAAVALDVGLQRLRTHDWSASERVALYPIATGHSPVAARYVQNLDEKAFKEIETYFAAQAGRYGIENPLPIDLKLRNEIHELPPEPPVDAGFVATAWWSLRLRYWAWRVTRDDPGPDTRIRLFLVYHDPATQPELPHSLGLRELLAGVSHLFASRQQQSLNNIVIAHELMHTLGASDKYDEQSNLPIYPHGYAEPGRKPLYPQRAAEIMGGRIAISESSAEMPANLRATLVGEKTASEIAWQP